ncbi:MAG: cyclic-di-AMP receptor [Eubacteriales bacterium]|nr:cyclic-di-AMP receptor [Eubacteriales bacterium]
MEEAKKKKLVFAVLHEEDYEKIIRRLNDEKIFVTKLSSSGGFLRKKNYTIMLGIDVDQLETVRDIFRTNAGRREEIVYTTPASMNVNVPCAEAGMTIPMHVNVGGATMFVVDLDSLEKF